MVGYIKCEIKSVPQLIHISLEQARSDYKEIGLPLTLNMHDGQYASLLSQAYQDDQKNQKGELRGIVNLLSLLLLIANIKNILTSIDLHGFTLNAVMQ